ncbi:type IV toxin-antitoxin system AbiEi family antitoxin domain-containing protein [Dietzia sp. 179-F 9C3 NHS]|uniref:type IV toxin-antitoxin system AbiEi family antitoxin domain-containing protein n=1 Tax=Dietzia sp. 179-F 9C3 NHS TaxID=3374295 RepID=UPI003879E256
MSSNGTAPRLVSSAELVERGVTRRRLESLIRTGELVRVRRGLYVAGADVPTGVFATEDRIALRARAAASGHRDGTVISHVSALAVHGLPVHDLDARRVTTTRQRPGSGTRASDFAICHSADLDGAVTEVDGMPVTSVARTVVDVARQRRFAGALCAADAAMKTGKCTLADLRAELDAAAGRSGIAHARSVIGFADGRAESVLESISRLAIHRLRLPAPELQVELRLSSGRVVRVDMFWEEYNLVGECDGVTKYGAERGVEHVRAVLDEEKVRQIEIEADGFRVSRWLMKHATDSARLGRILTTVMEQQQAQEFRRPLRS